MTDASGYRWSFESLRLEELPVGGRKNASRGGVFRELGSRGVRVCRTVSRSPFVPITTFCIPPTLGRRCARYWIKLDITNVALLPKRTAQARRIVHDAMGSDALRRMPSDRETVQNNAWSTARVAGVEDQLAVRP